MNMKQVGGYTVVLFVFLYLYNLDPVNIRGMMNEGTDLIASPLVSLAVLAVVAGFFFNWLVGYTGMSGIKTALTFQFVRIMIVDVTNVLNGGMDFMSFGIDVSFGLVVAYTLGTVYDKLAA